MPRADRSNSLTPSARSTAATCCEIPDWVAFSRSAARVNEPSSHTAMTARTCRSAIPAIPKPLLEKEPLLEKMIARGRIYYFVWDRHQVLFGGRTARG